MWRILRMTGARPEALALEANAARAGAALGCHYSSSAEYEAELVAARRAAGRYDPRRPNPQAALAWAAATFAVALLYLAA
jgi:hypothetical protein